MMVFVVVLLITCMRPSPTPDGPKFVIAGTNMEAASNLIVVTAALAVIPAFNIITPTHVTINNRFISVSLGLCGPFRCWMLRLKMLAFPETGT
jgi:hypothetical protein